MAVAKSTPSSSPAPLRSIAEYGPGDPVRGSRGQISGGGPI
ncbi:MAG TPA: hypothetical protein VJ885_07765 [Thermoanaerobaculia bacterium]|nr:hypothetical protein [Thermoanaerobaculia bacterium]